ncbi:hypothetical protein PGB90_004461 [Kerria lacca]
MSLLKSVIKLNKIKPLLSQTRLMQSHNHIIAGPPTVRIPHWKKMMLMGTFCVFMFTYPLYVTYMMHEWDVMDGNQ